MMVEQMKLRAQVRRERIDVTSWDSEPGSEQVWGGWRVTMTDGSSAVCPSWHAAMAVARNTLRTRHARREWDWDPLT